MLYRDKKDFINSKKKKIALIGMSGMGKTHLALKLLNDQSCAWDHFSVDYHIAKKYLINIIKKEIKDCLNNNEEWIQKMIKEGILHFDLNVSAENISVLSLFLSKLGDPKRGGLSCIEFTRRQQLYRLAEKKSIMDAIEYGRGHLNDSTSVVLDTTGSVCEIIDLVDDYDDSVILADLLAKQYLIIYLSTEKNDIKQLIDRQKLTAKPMLYNAKLLKNEIKCYLDKHMIKNIQDIDPDKFSLQLFEKTILSRQKKYLKLVDNRGIIIANSELTSIKNTKDLFEIIAKKL